MDADGAYLAMITEVIEVAKQIGITQPSDRLWSYREQHAVFSALGLELYALPASGLFRSGLLSHGGVSIVAYNANLPRVEQLGEMYYQLMRQVACHVYPDECARDPEWAKRAAKRAVRYWMRNLRVLLREAYQDEDGPPTDLTFIYQLGDDTDASETRTTT